MPRDAPVTSAVRPSGRWAPPERSGDFVWTGELVGWMPVDVLKADEGATFEQAGIAAAAKEQANAVKRERQREARRKSAAARRERKRQATSPSGPIRGPKDSEDDLDALERRIAPEWTPLCGAQIRDREGRLVFSRGYDRLDDESTLGKLADELRAAGVPNPRTAIIEDLADCRPDRPVVYEVEPELT